MVYNMFGSLESKGEKRIRGREIREEMNEK
jgi:hypothetical protein